MDIASAIAQAGQSGGTQMRVGRVRSYDTQLITVDVGGGTLVGMSYLRSYQPILGDSVVCVSTGGGVWVVMGNVAGSPPDNAVANPSFEADTPGSSAANWGVYHDPSSTADTHAVVVRANSGIAAIDGKQCLSVEVSDSGATGFRTSTDNVYSNAFAVTPGDRWTAAAWFTFNAGVSAAFLPAQATVGVYLSWHANFADVPPAVVSTTTNSVVGCNGSSPAWALLPASSPSTGNVVPNGAAWGRVVLSSTISVNGVNSIQGIVHWDNVLARKVP